MPSAPKPASHVRSANNKQTNKQTTTTHSSHVPHHQVHFKAKQPAPQTHRQHFATILEHLNDDKVKEEPKKNTLEKQVAPSVRRKRAALRRKAREQACAMGWWLGGRNLRARTHGVSSVARHTLPGPMLWRMVQACAHLRKQVFTLGRKA